MIDNIIVCLSVIFLIIIFVKSKKTIKEINNSRKKIEKVFLHFPNKR